MGLWKPTPCLMSEKPLRRRPHARHVFGVVLGRVAGHRKPHRAVVDAHPVADLAAQQAVHRQPGGFAGHIPERHLDDADGAAPRLERPAVADVEHDPLDLGRVLVQDERLVVEHVRLQIRLVRLGRGIAADACVRNDPYNGGVADHGALEISDAHLTRC